MFNKKKKTSSIYNQRVALNKKLNSVEEKKGKSNSFKWKSEFPQTHRNDIF